MDWRELPIPNALPLCRSRRRRLDDAALAPCNDTRRRPAECIVMYLEFELDETAQQYELCVMVVYVGNEAEDDDGEAGDEDSALLSMLGCHHAAQSRPCSSLRLAIGAGSHGSFDPV